MLIQDTGWSYDSEKGWVYNGKQHFHCEKCGSEDFVLVNGNYVCFKCSCVSRYLCTPITCASS